MSPTADGNPYKPAGERPEKGTPEFDLWVTAIDIAAAPPLSQGDTVWAAKVPWPLIHELRRALDELGIDWQHVKSEDEARRLARARERDSTYRSIERSL